MRICLLLLLGAGVALGQEALGPSWSRSENLYSARSQAVARRLLKNYDSTVRPGFTSSQTSSAGSLEMALVIGGKALGTDNGEAVVVNVTVFLVSLSSFDDVTMEFTGQIRFQQEWFDHRLAFHHEPHFRPGQRIQLAIDQDLWHPDTFFQNEQDGHVHLVDQPNLYISVRRDGAVRYNKRLTMSFSCPMQLQLFPHDNQTCGIEFGSYAYTTEDIIYQWSDPAVHQAPNVSESLPKFSIKGLANMSCTSATATGTYGCLKIQLLLQREFSYFLLQLYIPSCMLVFVACLSFWIDWRSAPSRVPLTIVTLLTITTQASGINAKLPPVSYTKAIDVWIGACVVFIFGSLIEYAIVNYIGSNEEKRLARTRRGAQLQAAKEAAADSLSGFPAFFHKLGLYQPQVPPNDPFRPLCLGEGAAASSLAPRPPSLGTKLRRRLSEAIRRRNRAGLGRCEAEGAEEGDCFNAEEYVEYRRRQEERAERERLRERSLWAKLLRGFTGSSRAERIDILSRLLFPLGFLGFNAVYWGLYLPPN